MVLDNATVLQNLLKQKVDIEQQLETLRANYMKVIGAIDILQQIEEANAQPEEEESEESEEE
tara:strand:+ start:952 stop:1137 length:186 start_codon:yes stop_codon:yes gene_type:complete